MTQQPLISKEIEEHLRQDFKYLNKFMVTMFRLGLGGWVNADPKRGGQIMVLTTTGRKSGLSRRVGLNYAIVNGEIYCCAGFGPGSDWYKNLIKNPQVEVWLPDGWWCGIAEDVSDSPYRLSLLREVLIASGFAARLAGIDAINITDDELAQVTPEYRLIHIKRTEARTGPGGPGDLAWIWPVSTLVLLMMLFMRRK